MKQVPVGELFQDIETLGQPIILVQMHGFLFKVQPDDYEQEEFDIVFFQFRREGKPLVKPVCRISMLDLVIKEKLRPDNLIIKCEKCYGLYNEAGESYCTLYWPEGWVGIKGYAKLTLTLRRILETTYKRHMAAMGTEARKKYTIDKIKEVKWDGQASTVNIYFKNGSWWHYTFEGTWY